LVDVDNAATQPAQRIVDLPVNARLTGVAEWLIVAPVEASHYELR
jgi:hypothetical protein